VLQSVAVSDGQKVVEVEGDKDDETLLEALENGDAESEGAIVALTELDEISLEDTDNVKVEKELKEADGQLETVNVAGLVVTIGVSDVEWQPETDTLPVGDSVPLPQIVIDTVGEEEALPVPL